MNEPQSRSFSWVKEFGLYPIGSEPLEASEYGGSVVRFAFEIAFSSSCMKGRFRFQNHRGTGRTVSKIPENLSKRLWGLSKG